MKSLTCRRLFAGILILSLANGATANVIYNTFGPDDAYLDWSFDVVGTPFSGDFIAWPGARFDVGPGEYDNISVTMPLDLWFVSDPTTFSFQVKLYQNDGTPEEISTQLYPGEHCPGTLLGTVDALGSDVQSGSPTTFNFDSVTLTGGANYWVTMESPLDEAGCVKWYLNSIDVMGFRAQKIGFAESFSPEWRLDYSSETSLNTMRIEGTPVPEPSSLILLLAGVGGAIRIRRQPS